MNRHLKVVRGDEDSERSPRAEGEKPDSPGAGEDPEKTPCAEGQEEGEEEDEFVAELRKRWLSPTMLEAFLETSDKLRNPKKGDKPCE